LWLSAAFCPGKENVKADKASREFRDETEWRLNPKMFKKICMNVCTPEIDLFASRLNKQLKEFCSWQPDPQARFVDAFTQSWYDLSFYAFPPFSLIPRVLQKINRDKAMGILLVPFWPTQPWMTSLQQMLVAVPLLLTVTQGTLELVHAPDKIHPLQGQLQILVCLCHGGSMEPEVTRERLSKFCSRPSGLLPIANIQRIYKNGNIFVRGTGKIPMPRL